MSLPTSNSPLAPVPPGRTIGLLGGGQLGRMFAIAARRMGYRVHTLDPQQDCPAGQIADFEVNAPYDDVSAAVGFARGVDVVTFEFENVPAATLEAVERIVPVRPSPFVLETTRHRLREKRFLQSHGFPLADFREVRTPDELSAALVDFNGGVLKTAEFGYDGKGQHKLAAGAEVTGAVLKQLSGVPCVLERLIPFDREISVIVARTQSGQCACYAPFANAHANHILDITLWPAPLPTAVAQRATELAVQIAQALDLVGLLCVEMFVVGDDLLVNELAPRPHNSGHVTFDASVTSQFEQQLRAVCGLPLGDVSATSPCAMANLLGDVWEAGEPDWAGALTDPRVKLHLYGKREPRAGRKMGHLVALAARVEEAEQIVRAARSRLTSHAVSAGVARG